MKYISKKQKILLIIAISIITLGIAYYSYVTKANDELKVEKQNLEIEENETESNKEEKEKNNKELEKIVVHISGAVKNEGIVELEENARVADAIEMAGGVTENAYMKDINLAELLEDGMKVYIPTKEEVESEKQEESTSYISGGTNSFANTNDNKSSSAKNSGTSTTGTSKTNGKININTASLEELDTLPGIGETTANKIISYREENGKFKSIEEIKEVKGIGDSKYEEIKDLIEI